MDASIDEKMVHGDWEKDIIVVFFALEFYDVKSAADDSLMFSGPDHKANPRSWTHMRDAQSEVMVRCY